ncbi:MAG TPA: dicarboxylate/amino acid:cation symporter [Gemmatimonadaceae bacterium]|nr:dicarboxylate/amino acid:cation symporter [Gemmatimonadaceae bacterium]
MKVLIGLVAGLLAGLLVAWTQSPTLIAFGSAIEPVGTIFINAIRMTVIPLVVASLIVGVASAPDARAVGRTGSRALFVFLVALAAAAVYTLLLAPPIFAALRIDPAAAAAMRESVAAAAGTVPDASALPSFAEWLVSLVPANPIRVAADGAMLPLIVFSIVFGLAMTKVEQARRDAVLRGVRGIAEAMLVLVRWVLELAPIGVFALALPLAARMGLAAAGAIAYYVVVVSALCLGFIALLYVAAITVGRVPFRMFAQAAAPAQAVAFSARSSLAALPAMIEGATTKLGLKTEITGFFLPLAASVFRIGSVIGMVVGVLFIAALYDVPLGGAQLLTIALTSLVLTFSVPGVPGGSILVMIPVLIAAGLPVEGVAILLAVDTIPDMFRTTLNVTGHMTAATILGRGALAPRPELASAAIAVTPES